MLKLVTDNPDANFFMDETPIGRNGLSAEVKIISAKRARNNVKTGNPVN